MADIRIKDLATTASVTASDDFMAVDGTTNGTRKLSAATPSFATSVTTPSLTSPASTNLTLTSGLVGTNKVNFPDTLSASSATAGAVTIGNGTAATNVAIGGGKVNIGDTTAGSSGAGALVVQGGISAGNTGSAASYFGGDVTAASLNAGTSPVATRLLNLRGPTAAGLSLQASGTSGISYSIFSTDTGASIGGGKLAIFDDAVGAYRFSLDATGATFAGAVTIGGTVIHTLSATPASASATGTVGTMSWDASYIYICTAANTWKRVAIATW